MKIERGMFNLKLNNKVKLNFINIKKRGLVPPLIFLVLLFIYFLFVAKGNFNDSYINIQKDLFFVINNKLSQYTSFFLCSKCIGFLYWNVPIAFIWQMDISTDFRR